MFIQRVLFYTGLIVAIVLLGGKVYAQQAPISGVPNNSLFNNGVRSPADFAAIPTNAPGGASSQTLHFSDDLARLPDLRHYRVVSISTAPMQSRPRIIGPKLETPPLGSAPKRAYLRLAVVEGESMAKQFIQDFFLEHRQFIDANFVIRPVMPAKEPPPPAGVHLPRSTVALPKDPTTATPKDPAAVKEVTLPGAKAGPPEKAAPKSAEQSKAKDDSKAKPTAASKSLPKPLPKFVVDLGPFVSDRHARLFCMSVIKKPVTEAQGCEVVRAFLSQGERDGFQGKSTVGLSMAMVQQAMSANKLLDFPTLYGAGIDVQAGDILGRTEHMVVQVNRRGLFLAKEDSPSVMLPADTIPMPMPADYIDTAAPVAPASSSVPPASAPAGGSGGATPPQAPAR